MTGEVLKELLSSLKVSQTDIAKKIGVSQQSFNQMLNASDIKSGLLERVSSAIGISVSRLYELAKSLVNGCGCPPSTITDQSFYHPSSDGTCNGPGTEEEGRKSESEQARFYKEQAAFYKEQAEFYKQQLDSLKDKQ